MSTTVWELAGRTPTTSGGRAVPVRVRPFAPDDAEGLCALFAAADAGPAHFGRAFGPDDLLRMLDEVGIVRFLVAEMEPGRIVGSVGLSPVSAQRPSRRGGVFVDHLMVHPSVRFGFVVRWLVLAAGTAVFEAGYDRLDMHVETWNRRVERAYRRLGARRLSDEPTEDGCLPLVHYGPLALRYVIENGLGYDHFAFMRRPTLGLGASTGPGDGSDLVDWHGRGVVPVEVRLGPSGTVHLLVDPSSDHVVHASAHGWGLGCWVEPGAVPGAAGTTVRCVVTGPEAAAARPRPAGADGLRPVGSAPLPDGRGVEHAFRRRPEPDGPDATGFSLDLPDSAGRGTLVVGATGPRRPAVRIAHVPAARAGAWLACGDGGWLAVDEAGTRYRLDGATGSLWITDDEGRPLVHELWPDVGPPHPGGYKAPIERVVGGHTEGDGTLVLDSPGNAWLALHLALAERHARLAGLVVRRRFRIAGPGRLRIETEVVVPAGWTGGPAQLRTWPRAELTEPSLHPPRLRTGRWAPAEGRRLPFLAPNFESARCSDLPFDPAAYAEPWAAMSGGGRTVGLVFPGATEVRFGDRWMPSAVYRLAPVLASAPASVSVTPAVALPPYVVCAGPGGADLVRQAWRQEVAAG